MGMGFFAVLENDRGNKNDFFKIHVIINSLG